MKTKLVLVILVLLVAAVAYAGGIGCCTQKRDYEAAMVSALNAIGPEGKGHYPLELALRSSDKNCGWKSERYSCE